MTSLVKETLSFKPLHDLLNGAIQEKLLLAGLELKIFDVLSTRRTAGAVAELIGTHPENTRVFLNALSGIGLVEKNEGKYCNTVLSDRFLISSSELYLGRLFSIIREMSIDPLDNACKRVKNGPLPPQPADDAASQAMWAESARACAGWIMGEMGCRIARIVSALPGFSGFEKMLDLGGGNGLFALYLVDAHETMAGVVFDRPSVVDVAAEFIETYGMSERITVMPGDYMTDDFGGNYDLIWASATLHFVKYSMEDLVKKVYAALKPGGYFISFQDGMTHEQTMPDTTLGWIGGILTAGRDMRLEQGEIADAMLRCGFARVRSSTIETPVGKMDLDIARK